MATNSVGGSTSTIDVESIVSQLMKIERRPVSKLDVKIANKEIEISAFGSLKAKASALESALSALEKPTTFSAKSVSSSDPSIVTADATGSAVVGNIDVKVVSTARSMRTVVNGFASETSAVGNGTLTLETGAYSTSNGVTSFVASATKSLTVSSGATLTDLRDLINGADAGVRASIVKTGSTFSLVLNSSNTGTENAFRVSSSNPQNLPGGGAPDFTSLNFSAATGDSSAATLLQSAQNAVVYVDGLRVERSSNTIDNALPGVSLQLRKPTSLNDVSEAQSTSIAVTEQAGQAKSALDQLVFAYNDLVQTYKSLTVANVDVSKRGVLNSDSVASSLISGLRSAMASNGLSYSTTDSNGATVTSKLDFWQLGVELQRDGTLKLESTRFATAQSDGTIDKLKKGVTIEAQAFLRGATEIGGLLEGRTASAEGAKKTLQTRKSELEAKLTLTEANLRRRYAALDATLFKLSNINTSLQQTLDQINASNSN